MMRAHVGTGAPIAVQTKLNSAVHSLLAIVCLTTLALIGGCSGVVTKSSSSTISPAQQTQSYSVSGTISPTAGGAGATISLTGAASATATADGSGAYSFGALANGTYTVTPSHTGYSFSPVSQNVTVSGNNITGLNFTATVQTGQTYTVSGTISPTVGGSGTTVTLSGAATGATTANSSGGYTFTGLVNGTYAVTPSRTGYTFSPVSQSATINGANVTGLNFTATAQGGQAFSLSGTISPTTGGAGATVTLSGAVSATAAANSSGIYTFSGLINGNYTVTPSHTGYSFTPVSLSKTVSGANVTGVNFTAVPLAAHSAIASWTASTSVISGYNVYRGTVSGGPYTKLNSSLIALLTYTDTTVQSGQTYFFVTTAVDGSGNESVFSNEVTAVIP
jgi:Carboxypeptidase regulatory-like domain